MSETVYGRTLIGDSLGFHILFALLGVGIPLLIAIFELIGIWKRDKEWTRDARNFSKVQTILFVAGAISGTLISFQFSAVWPIFTKISGQVVGLSFFLEGFAFMIEAVFLGIYMLSWDKFRPIVHWLTILPVVICSLTSAVFITTVNAFMNAPQGFSYAGGKVSAVNPWVAIFNPATFTEVTHSVLAYYLATAAIFASWYAYRLLRGRVQLTDHGKNRLLVLAGIAMLFAVLVGLTGDRSAKYLAEYEPLKLAAAEGLRSTQGNAPLQIGGLVIGDTLVGAVSVPGLLSWLAFGSTTAVVKGLDIATPQMWPPLVVHYFFDLMVLVGMLIPGILVIFLLANWKWKKRAWSKLVLLAMCLLGPLAILAVELGWMLTEIGRQPWAIKGVLLTNDAVTTSSDVLRAAVAFPILYVLLILVSVVALRHFLKGEADA